MHVGGRRQTMVVEILKTDNYYTSIYLPFDTWNSWGDIWVVKAPLFAWHTHLHKQQSPYLAIYICTQINGWIDFDSGNMTTDRYHTLNVDVC